MTTQITLDELKKIAKEIAGDRDIVPYRGVTVRPVEHVDDWEEIYFYDKHGDHTWIVVRGRASLMWLKLSWLKGPYELAVWDVECIRHGVLPEKYRTSFPKDWPCVCSRAAP